MADTEKVIDGLYRLRSDLKFMCAGIHRDYYNNSMIYVSEAIQTIRELQAQIPKWHLCSEELPAEYGYYLCQLKGTRNYGGNIQVCKYCKADKFNEHDYFDHMRNGFPNVIAWMELLKFSEVE